jgi:hypothetical protein
MLAKSRPCATSRICSIALKQPVSLGYCLTVELEIVRELPNRGQRIAGRQRVRAHGVKWRAFEELEAKITELWGHLNAATHRFLMLIAEFDREKAHERHGLVNTARWLNWQCGIGSVAARENVRVARALEQQPEISDAFATGEISYSKVRAMTRVATPTNESVLVHIARCGTAAHVEKLVRKYHWTLRRDAGKLARLQHAQRDVTYFFDENGGLILNARLPPEVGAVVRKALEVAVGALREPSEPASTLHLQQLNREAGRAINAETSRCQWRGERMDYSMAVEAIQFSEQKAARPSPIVCTPS